MTVYVIEIANSGYHKGDYLNTQHMLYEWHTSAVVYATLEAAMERVERHMDIESRKWHEVFDAMVVRAWVIEQDYADFWTATRILELEVIE